MKRQFLTLLLVAFSLQAAHAQWWTGSKKVNGNGDLTTETRSVGSYDQVALEGNMDVQLVAGSEGNLSIQAESNLMEYILTEVSGGRLKISVERGINLNPSRNRGIKVIVPFESLDGVSLTGSGDLYTSDRIRARDFEIRLTGSGDMLLELESGYVDAKLTGSGDISLKGKAENFSCTVTGSGDFDAYDLEAETADARVLGSGDIQLHASRELKASVSGSGDIRYRGNPEREDFKTHGSGSVSKS